MKMIIKRMGFKLDKRKPVYYEITRRQIYWLIFLLILIPIIIGSSSYKDHVRDTYLYLSQDTQEKPVKKKNSKTELLKDGLSIIPGWNKEKYSNIKVEKSNPYEVEPIRKGTNFSKVIEEVGHPMQLQPSNEFYREVLHATWNSPFDDGHGICVRITYDKETNRVVEKEISVD
ncbi:hypothetical protein JZO81_10415 [Enterococcus hulanensis]|nr:hypothetical protein [Enterococcus hulanensis]MBO0411475.1 hypothetical protein [Enterococcus hulanensis]